MAVGTVRATVLGVGAWDVVLDAGRRRDAAPEAWGELRDKGMAKGERLTPHWRDVATSLGRPEAELEILARRGAMRFRTSLAVLGRVCVLRTRRERSGGPGEITAEPRVLVQVVDRAAVFDAVVAVLPPVDELRVDTDVGGDVPIRVPARTLPFDDAISLDDGPASVPDPRPAADADEPSVWLSARELMMGDLGVDLRPDEATVAAIGARIARLSEEPTADESADALASVPGVDARLAELLRDPETEVTVVRTPGRRSITSADEALGLLGGLALRQWVVTPHGLVAVRADSGGLEVCGVEPGDLAREVRHLVAGDLPDIDRIAERLGGES